jgi:hypothetical protein
MTPTPTLVPMTEFQKGISYVSGQEGGFSSPSSDTIITDKIKSMGVNWLAVIVTCYQKTIHSTEIQCNQGPDTASDEDLAHVIQKAHSAGLKVMLKPHVDLSKDHGRFRSQIEFYDEASWNLWFASYREFITHYAAIAEEFKADYFVIGTELDNTVSHSEQWRALIIEVRKIFKGPVTYASTSDAEEKVTWWDALDAIGIDAYYRLTDSYSPSLGELLAGWQPVIARLEQISGQWHRPVIFTEAGYNSIAGANQMYPDLAGSALDIQQQALRYRALFEAMAGKPWWYGVFWWAMDTSLNQGGLFDSGYNPANKPAEDVIRAYFLGQPRKTETPTPMVELDDTHQMVIYSKYLRAGWKNWSWGAKVAFPAGKLVIDHPSPIRVSLGSFGALSLHYPRLDTSPYYSLEFYIFAADNSARQLVVYLNDENDKSMEMHVYLNNLAYMGGKLWKAGEWQRVLIPLADMGGDNTKITRINIADESGNGQPDFYVDSIRLIARR